MVADHPGAGCVGGPSRAISSFRAIWYDPGMIARNGSNILISQPGEWTAAVGINHHGKLWELGRVTDIVDRRRRKCRMLTIRMLWILEMSWMGPDHTRGWGVKATWDQKRKWGRRYKKARSGA